MDPGEAAEHITRWAAKNPRPLPWRKDHDPYHVLVAEFILQQTRMEVGVPRFHSFTRRFPTISALAAARESSVLAEWSGLGYYARARNLRHCAREILKRFGGVVPADAETLRELPGIGPYTAGAIASIAYDRPEPSLDGNQFRVYGRFLGVDVSTKTGRQEVERFARQMLASGSPRILNQAVMDLGGSVCSSRSPTCGACPLIAGCATRGEGARPKASRGTNRVEDWAAATYVRNGRVWLAAPKNRGLLGTHWLPPLERTAQRRVAPDLAHTFSHRTWRVWWATGRGEPSGDGKWVAPEDLKRLPHGPLTRKFVEAALATGVARPRADVRASRRAVPSRARV